MKPYVISTPRIDSECIIIYAETPGKAKAELWRNFDDLWPERRLQYTEIKAKLAKPEDLQKWDIAAYVNS